MRSPRRSPRDVVEQVALAVTLWRSGRQVTDADESGQTSAEYLGVVVLVALVVVALVTDNPVGNKIRDALVAQIDRISGSK